MCPGSLALESTLDQVEESNEYQAEGKLLHDLTANPSKSRAELEPAQLDLILAVEAAEKEFAGKVLPSGLDYLELTEEEFSLGRNGKTILKGTPDSVLVYQSRRTVAVKERKYGFKAVQSADANLQLRSYLVLVAEAHPADAYYGCLVQPRISSRPHIVHYTMADIVSAKQEIEAIYAACFAPHPPRAPSPAGCEFCKAQAVCDEFKSWAFAITKSQHLPSAQWSDETWSEFLTKRPVVEKFLKERLEDAKLIKQANPERLPGWRLKDGNEVRTVEDIVGAFGAMQSHLTAQEFSSACTMALGDIEELVWKKHKDNPALGKLSQKDARRLVDSILASFITKKRNKPSLVKDE